MKISRATLNEVEAIAPLFDRYRLFYQLPSDPAAAKQFIKERLMKGESVIFHAYDDGTEFGFVQLYPSFSSLSMRRSWILNDLYVEPEARRQGVGRGLLETAMEYSSETGAKGLTLKTALDNLPAQSLYRALGWVRDERYYSFDFTSSAR